MTSDNHPGPLETPAGIAGETVNGRPTITALITRAGIVGWSFIGLLLAGYLVLIVVRWFEVLLAPVVFAVVLIYLLNPVVNRLHRLGLHRILGSIVAYLILAAMIVILGFLVVPSVADQAGEFADNFPTIYEDSATEIESLVSDLGFGEVQLWSYEEVQKFLNDPENQDQIISAALSRPGSSRPSSCSSLLRSWRSTC